jgi:hypothetical protein
MILGQGLTGSVPRDNESLNWTISGLMSQTSVYGDIKAWQLERVWLGLCKPVDAWTDVTPSDIQINRCGL